jgi:hypothetical protein
MGSMRNKSSSVHSKSTCMMSRTKRLDIHRHCIPVPAAYFTYTLHVTFSVLQCTLHSRIHNSCVMVDLAVHNMCGSQNSKHNYRSINSISYRSAIAIEGCVAVVAR